MFKELNPLIQQRPLTITVAAEGDGKLRVNVIPQPVEKDKQANKKIQGTHEKEVAPIPDTAIQGLTTPLCLTGTPEEIDAGLSEALTKFTTSHATLQQSYDSAAEQIAAAVKAIDEREKLKKQKDKDKEKNKDKDKSKRDSKKVAEDGERKEEPGLPSLFTAPVSAGDEASTRPTGGTGQ
jgi:PRTRC genetic system protein E